MSVCRRPRRSLPVVSSLLLTLLCATPALAGSSRQAHEPAAAHDRSQERSAAARRTPDAAPVHATSKSRPLAASRPSGTAVVPSADPSSPYGINTHIPSVAALDRVAEAGIGWVRFDFNWFQIEPDRDRYDWAVTDTVVQAAAARGLQIFATLAYTPGWANGGGVPTEPPFDPADWEDFVYDTVSRYRGVIHHWGMWNEPNLGDFFAGTREEYIDNILIRGADAVKAADPASLVLGPELAYLQSGDWRVWLHQVLSEAGDRIDIVTQHCYSDTGDQVVKNMVGSAPPWKPTAWDIMNRTGMGDRPLWLTETGWHTDEVSESTQAKYYEQILNGVLQSAPLEKVFFYELTDDPNISQKWGILRSDLSPKESFYRYQSFIASH